MKAALKQQDLLEMQRATLLPKVKIRFALRAKRSNTDLTLYPFGC